MMLTMTPKNAIAARTALNSGRAACGVVGGGIRVVFLGDSLMAGVAGGFVSILVSRDYQTISDAGRNVSRDYQTISDAGRNNRRCIFYRYDATATYAKPQHGVVHHSEDGGRDGRVLSSAWRPQCGEG